MEKSGVIHLNNLSPQIINFPDGSYCHLFTDMLGCGAVIKDGYFQGFYINVEKVLRGKYGEVGNKR